MPPSLESTLLCWQLWTCEACSCTCAIVRQHMRVYGMAADVSGPSSQRSAKDKVKVVSTWDAHAACRAEQC